MNIGDKFGRWTIIDFDDNKKKVICKCDCGKIKSVWKNNLTTGKTLSCGCLISETTAKRNYKHGGTKTRLYNVWSNMKGRCYDPHDTRYQNYGARGITVCDEWMNFANFREWAMMTGYKNDAKYGECTLERINVNGNYYPDNCRWATIKEQNFNRSSNKILEYKGKKQTLTEWEHEIGCNSYVIGNRLRKGWTVEEALSIPIGGKRVHSRADSIH